MDTGYGGRSNGLFHAFCSGWVRMALVELSMLGAFALFHAMLLAVLAGGIATMAVAELLPALDPKSEPGRLASEWAGVCVALGLTLAYMHWTWWPFACAVGFGGGLWRLWQGQSARRPGA